MKNHATRKLISLALSSAMICSLALPVGATGEYTDMPSDYSTTALKAAIENGLIGGVGDGKIDPTGLLTRAQMATILVAAFGENGAADLSAFTDVNLDAWYADEMAEAVQMGAFAGDGTNMRPNDAITRQEAFTVLAATFKMATDDLTVLDQFADKASIAGWAIKPTAALVAAGVVAGDDTGINPTANITRKDFAVIMNQLVGTYIDESGTVTEVADGSVMINTANVTLKGVTVKGDLIVGDGVGDGTVTLDGVTIEGKLLARGGGEHSVIIKGASKVPHVSIAKVEGGVRVAVQGSAADVEVIHIDDGKSDVIIEGTVKTVSVNASETPVVIRDAKIEAVEVVAAKANVTLGDDAKVTTVTAQAAAAAVTVQKGAEIENVVTTEAATAATVTVDKGAKVDTVTATGAGTAIAGTGTVENVKAEGNDVKVETAGTKVEAAEGVTGTTAGDKEIAGGTSDKAEGSVPTVTTPTYTNPSNTYTVATAADFIKYVTVADYNDTIQLTAPITIESESIVGKGATVTVSDAAMVQASAESILIRATASTFSISNLKFDIDLERKAANPKGTAILSISSATAATLDNITMTGSANGVTYSGAGSFTVKNSAFKMNSDDTYNNDLLAIATTAAGADVAIENTTVAVTNTTTDNYSAGIRIAAGATTVKLDKVTVNHTASDAIGAAYAIYSSSAITSATDVTIADGFAFDFIQPDKNVVYHAASLKNALAGAKATTELVADVTMADGTVFGGYCTALTIAEGATLTVPAGKTLTVLAGKTITIEEGATLTNNGTIVVNDAAGLTTALAIGGKVELGGDITITGTISDDLSFTKNLTLDLNDHTLRAETGIDFGTEAYTVQNGTISLTTDEEHSSIENLQGGTVSFVDVAFTKYGSQAIWTTSGSVSVDKCTFTPDSTHTISTYAIIVDNATTLVTVKDSTFGGTGWVQAAVFCHVNAVASQVTVEGTNSAEHPIMVGGETNAIIYGWDGITQTATVGAGGAVTPAPNPQNPSLRAGGSLMQKTPQQRRSCCGVLAQVGL